jgi:hypothetical protein
MTTQCLAGLALCFCLTAQAQKSPKAAQVCGWIAETNDHGDYHQYELWLQSESELEFMYAIGGEGIVSDHSKSHSPSKGSFVLHPGKAEKAWTFGSNVSPPAKIDFLVELHTKPASVFSEESTPLIAKFTFRRDVPESETSVPPVFAKKQCIAIKKDK